LPTVRFVKDGELRDILKFTTLSGMTGLYTYLKCNRERVDTFSNTSLPYGYDR